jgi:hypothetical protein
MLRYFIQKVHRRSHLAKPRIVRTGGASGAAVRKNGVIPGRTWLEGACSP